jgi:hypothetical protein
MDDLLHGVKDIYCAENQSQRGEGRRQKIVDGRVTQRGEPAGGALKQVRSIVAGFAVDLWSGFPQTLQHKLF